MGLGEDLDERPIRPHRLLLCEDLGVIALDFLNAHGLLEVLETLALTPRIPLARFGIDLLVALRELEEVGVLLPEPHPLGLALEEAEVTPGAGAPLVVVGNT